MGERVLNTPSTTAANGRENTMNGDSGSRLDASETSEMGEPGVDPSRKVVRVLHHALLHSTQAKRLITFISSALALCALCCAGIFVFMAIDRLYYYKTDIDHLHEAIIKQSEFFYSSLNPEYSCFTKGEKNWPDLKLVGYISFTTICVWCMAVLMLSLSDLFTTPDLNFLKSTNGGYFDPRDVDAAIDMLKFSPVFGLAVMQMFFIELSFMINDFGVTSLADIYTKFSVLSLTTWLLSSFSMPFIFRWVNRRRVHPLLPLDKLHFITWMILPVVMLPAMALYYIFVGFAAALFYSTFFEVLFDEVSSRRQLWLSFSAFWSFRGQARLVAKFYLCIWNYILYCADQPHHHWSTYSLYIITTIPWGSIALIFLVVSWKLRGSYTYKHNRSIYRVCSEYEDNTMLDGTIYGPLTGIFPSNIFIPYTHLEFEGRPFACGAAGSIYKGRYCGDTVAIKQFNNDEDGYLDEDTFTDGIKEICDEVRVLAVLRHPRFIDLYGISSYNNRLLMVMEYVPFTLENEVTRWMKSLRSGDEHRPPGLGLSDSLRLMYEFCTAVAYLHHTCSPQIVHRDLKPANILLSKDERGRFHIKVCDLGIAALSTLRASSPPLIDGFTGTPGFMPPEAIVASCYERGTTREVRDLAKWDIFSSGIVCWYLWTLCDPYEEFKFPLDINRAVLRGERPSFDENGAKPFPSELKELVQRMWAHDPNQRPTAQQTVDLLESMMESSGALTGNAVDDVRESLWALSGTPGWRGGRGMSGGRDAAVNEIAMERHSF